MKKIKHATQENLEELFPRKISSKEEIIENCKDKCTECNDILCKAQRIMDNLRESTNLADQIGHQSLFNILLTLCVSLQHLSSHEILLLKIEKVCRDVYSEFNPKEMGIIIN